MQRADADKSGYAGYFEQLLRLVRAGGVIAVDNVLWCDRKASVLWWHACSLRADSAGGGSTVMEGHAPRLQLALMLVHCQNHCGRHKFTCVTCVHTSFIVDCTH